jgi:HK97 family phage major capsid protein
MKGGKIDYSFETKIIRNAVIKDPDNFVSGIAPVVLPFREIGVDKAPVRMPVVSDIISWGTTTSNMVDWIERTGKTNGAAARLEGGTMGEGDLTYTEVSTKVKIMSEYMKITNESLKDVDFLSGEINSELLSDLRVLTDTQLLNGDGTGANLLGIIPQATAWAAGNFAATIVSPNNADVLRVGITQIVMSGQGRWFPNYILMNPEDVAVLDLAKIADGRYIEIPYYNPDTPSVVSVPILQNPGISVGDFLIGDFTKAKAFLRDSLTVRIFDQNEDDPINNRSTVTANVRLAFRIKNQEKAAFVTGDFASAITALTKT